MSVLVPASPNNHQEVARSTENFPHGFGADYFLITYNIPHDTVSNEYKKQKIEELKEVREELKKASAVKSPELLKLIDSIQLLGVAYHFEREIEEALKDIYETCSMVDDNEDLTTSSLRF